MFVIPNQESKTHLQDNVSDLSGTIFKSRNIDLDDKGYIKLASPTVTVMTEDDDVDLDTVDAMYAGDGNIILNGDEVFFGYMDMTVFADRSGDTGRPTPSEEEDIIFFNDTEVSTDGSSAYYKSGSSAWTSISLSMSTLVPTAMASWETEGVLAVGNNNKVKFVKQDWSVHATVLTLPPDFQVSSLAVQGSQLFIGTRSKSGAEAMMFVVSTIQVGIDFSYGVGTFEVCSIKPFKSSVVLITSNGSLLRFNGGGFDVLAVLPVFKKNIEWADAQNDYSTTGNRSMVIDGDLIYIIMTNETQNGVLRILPDFLAGVWCFDSANNSLYHRYAPTWSQVKKMFGPSLSVNTTTNVFTFSGSPNLDLVITGMPFLFKDASTPTMPEIKESTAYYIIKDSSTTFRVASSYADAIAGNEIDISGAIDSSQTFYVQLTNDYGFGTFESRTAIAVLNNLMFDNTLMGRICLTANIAGKQSVDTRTVISGISPFLPNRGYFVTPRLNSSNLEDEYTNAHIKHAPLKDDDLIIVKFKDVEKYGYPFSSYRLGDNTKYFATWSSTTVFTCTTDLSEVIAGEEIEIIWGVGSGHISKIESITEDSGTYTVTLSEAFPFAVSGDLMMFNVDNWKEAGRITSATQKKGGGFVLPVGKKSKFVQVKVEMRGVKIKVEELIINNKPHKPVV